MINEEEKRKEEKKKERKEEKKKNEQQHKPNCLDCSCINNIAHYARLPPVSAKPHRVSFLFLLLLFL